jgi:hypothetical protein
MRVELGIHAQQQGLALVRQGSKWQVKNVKTGKLRYVAHRLRDIKRYFGL